MTDSGYPRTVYEWRRGTPLSEATKVYEGEKSDVAVSGYAYLDRGHRYELRSRSITFYTSAYEARRPGGSFSPPSLPHLSPISPPSLPLSLPYRAYEVRRPDGSFSEVPVPEDADIETFADQLLVTLRTARERAGRWPEMERRGAAERSCAFDSDLSDQAWLGHEAGALLAAPLEPFLDADGDEARRSLLVPLFTPTESCSLEGSSATKSRLVLSVLQDVVNESRFWRYAAGAWSLEQTVRSEGCTPPSPPLGARVGGGRDSPLPTTRYAVSSFSAVDAEAGDAVWTTTSSYTQPTALSLADAGSPLEQEPLKSLPAFFNADGLKTQQLFATSADGTRVPYFLVSKEGLPLDGSTPTLLYG